MIKTYTLKVHYEDGNYWAEVVELPGCFATGRTMDELKEALGEAIGMVLEPPRTVTVEFEEPSPPAVKEVRARAELIAC